jgi:RecA/RadA recombinase
VSYESYRIILDTPAEKAGLGFPAIAQALANSIVNSRPRFAIGIFGPWGSGKTTLMDAVRRELDPDQTVAVEFSAWRYEKEEYLLVPLLDTIRESLVEWASRIEAAKAPDADKVRDAVLATAGTVGKVITSLVAGLSLKVGLPGAIELSFEANNALAKAKELREGEPSSLLRWLRPGGSETQRQVARRSDPNFPQSVYHACFRELRAAFGELRTHLKGLAGASRDLRFVVFVDDLDRCLPQGALEVLEAMKLFFEMEGFVFVVGLDRSVVERFIEQRYSEAQSWTTTAGASGTVVAVPEKRPPLVSGADYIKKIFQVPYTLAPVPLSLLDDLLQVIQAEADLPDEQAADLRDRVRRHLQVALSEVAVNPREVKRYINSYVMQMKISPHLDPDVVLALQTIKARSDWDVVHQAIGAYRDEFVTALQKRLSGDTRALAFLDPELTNLPDSFLEYVSSTGPAQALVTVGTAIDEYLYSVESTGTTHGAVLLEVLPLLFEARGELQKATTANASTQFSLAQQSLRKARSVVGNLETFPAIRDLVRDLDAIATTLVPPPGDTLDHDQQLGRESRRGMDEITALIRRTRALRRRDLDLAAAV